MGRRVYNTGLELLKGLRRRLFPPADCLAPAQPAVEPGAPRLASAGLILIVEAGGWTGAALPRLLEQAGYSAQLVTAQAAVEVLRCACPILLIVGGSAERGLYRALRAASPAPILALALARDEEQALAAFEAGVDQCQTGYVSDAEIVARVRALLRRRA